MSTGSGIPKESTSHPTTLLQRDVMQQHPFRLKSSRAAFNDAVAHFGVFPFSVRALTDVNPQHKLGLKEGMNHQVFLGRPVLVEAKGDIVASFKMTVLVLPPHQAGSSASTMRLTALLPPPYVHSVKSIDTHSQILDLLKTNVKIAKAKIPV